MKKLLAVYGSLRQDLGNSHHLINSKFLGFDVISNGFIMKSLGGFPALFNSDNGKPIVIEVYEINEDTNRSIEHLEGYPMFYNRRMIHTKYGPASVYYIEDSDDYSGHEEVTSGDWAEFLDTVEE